MAAGSGEGSMGLIGEAGKHAGGESQTRESPAAPHAHHDASFQSAWFQAGSEHSSGLGGCVRKRKVLTDRPQKLKGKEARRTPVKEKVRVLR